MINRAFKDCVLIETPVLNVAINTHKHLFYYSASAYVKMANFRIALITLGQPDINTLCF